MIGKEIEIEKGLREECDKEKIKFSAHYPCSKCNRVATKLICVPCVDDNLTRIKKALEKMITWYTCEDGRELIQRDEALKILEGEKLKGGEKG